MARPLRPWLAVPAPSALTVAGALVASAVGALAATACREGPRGAPGAAASAVGGAAALASVGPAAAPGRPELPPPRLVRASPSAERLEPGEAVELAFEGELDPGRIEVTTAPPVPVELRWPDARTLRLQARPRWRPGRAVGVRVVHRAADGTATELWARSLWPRVPAPARVTPGEGGLAVLTFDDAPARSSQAERLLELLAVARVRAVLFPTGRWAAAHPAWVERAVRGGHLVCNHSATHRNLTLPQLTLDDVRREIVEGASDGRCRLFRPPLMALDARVTRVTEELGWQLYLWDVDTRDWEGAPAEDLVNRVLGRVFPGAVVLFHQHGAHTLEALPVVAERLRAAGYVLSWDLADQTAAPGSAASAALPDAPPDAPPPGPSAPTEPPGSPPALDGGPPRSPPRVAVPSERWAALLDPARPRPGVAGSAAPVDPVDPAGADADEPTPPAPDQPPPAASR